MSADPAVLFFHCKRCVESRAEQKLAVFVDADNVVFVTCERHDPPLLVASMDASPDIACLRAELAHLQTELDRERNEVGIATRIIARHSQTISRQLERIRALEDELDARPKPTVTHMTRPSGGAR